MRQTSGGNVMKVGPRVVPIRRRRSWGLASWIYLRHQYVNLVDSDG